MPNFDPSCIDVMDYLECMDIQNVDRATEKEVRYSCPLPAHATGDETPSAYMNIETTAFFCHSCHAKGNAVTLAATVLRISPVQATRFLRERYSKIGINPDARSMIEEVRKIFTAKPAQKKNEILDESVLDAYYMDWNQVVDHHPALVYLQAVRNFSYRTLYKWQFGWCESMDRVTLPVRDENGHLVGIKARSLDDRKPKYLNLHDRDNGVKPFLKNEVVFALDRVKNHEDAMIIVEGEYNAIAMHDFHGFENTVAINGSYFGERQIKLIKRNTNKAILFFDTDQAGMDATFIVRDALMPFIDVWVCPDHYGDPMVMHPYSVQKCIAEAGPLRELARV